MASQEAPVWLRFYSNKRKRSFYFNKITKETIWEKPLEPYVDAPNITQYANNVPKNPQQSIPKSTSIDGRSSTDGVACQRTTTRPQNGQQEISRHINKEDLREKGSTDMILNKTPCLKRSNSGIISQPQNNPHELNNYMCNNRKESPVKYMNKSHDIMKNEEIIERKKKRFSTTSDSDDSDDLISMLFAKQEKEQRKSIASATRSTCTSEKSLNTRTKIVYALKDPPPIRESINTRTKIVYESKSPPPIREPSDTKAKIVLTRKPPSVREPITYRTSQNFQNKNPSPEKKPIFDLRQKLQQKKLDNLTSQTPLTQRGNFSQDKKVSPVIAKQMIGSNNRHESPREWGDLPFTVINIICDTNILIDNHFFFNKLLTEGSHIGVPIRLVIPEVVINEIQTLPFKCRKALIPKLDIVSTMINQNKTNKAMWLQPKNISSEAVDGIELMVCDDFILNCALQTRNERDKDEYTILMTLDNILKNKAKGYKLEAFDRSTFTVWLKGLREKMRPTFQGSSRGNTSTSGDTIPSFKDEKISSERKNFYGKKSPVNQAAYAVHSFKGRVSPLQNDDKLSWINDDIDAELEACNEVLTSDGIVNDEKNQKLQQKIHIQNLDFEIRYFCNSILVEAQERENRSVESSALRQLNKNWNHINYLSEINRKWFLITGKRTPFQSEQEVFTSLRHSLENIQGDNFKNADLEETYKLCESLATIMSKYAIKHGCSFKQSLRLLRNEWRQDKILFSNPGSTVGVENVAKVALEKIYLNLYQDFEDLKEAMNDSIARDSSIDPITYKMGMLVSRIYSLETILYKILEKGPGAEPLTSDNRHITYLHNLMTDFSTEKGKIEINVNKEKVLALFLDADCLKYVQQMLRNLINLKTDADRFTD